MSKGFNHIPKLIDQMKRNAVEAGLTAVGQLIEEDAKLLSAVDSGALQTDIKYIVDMTDNVVRIGTAIEYSPYVEFGTGIYAEGGNGRKTPWFYDYKGKKGPKGRRRTVGQKPQPFLRPALDQRKGDIQGLFETAVDAAIRKATQ